MDLTLLRALSARQRFRSLRHAVPEGTLEDTTLAMLQWFEVYWAAYPEHEFIQVESLTSLIRLRSGHASPEAVALTLHTAKQLENPIDDATLAGMLGQLHELDLAGRAAALVTRYQNGEEVELAYELSRLSQSTVRSMSQSTPDDYIQTPIAELLAEISDDKGIKFRRLMILAENVAAVQGGASIAIGARPDKGKTSFIANTITDFAPQCREFFGDRPILWLNNEGSGKRIIPRVYQAALGLDLPGIIELSNKGELESEYTKAIGGWREMIRVKDMHGASMAQIEQVEQLWQEWREMAVRHDFVGMATVQISAEGGNNLWPPYSALKDSKTGIQGATDLILLLGSMDDPSMQAIRGISTPKNKFAMPGRQSYVTGQIVMDAGRCVFSDSPETPVATFPGGPANAQAIQPPARVALGPAVAPQIPGPGAIGPDAG